MSNPSIATFLLAVLISACTLSTPPSSAAPTNLIAIVTDDQARWGMRAYGTPQVITPNMDRIAAEGALFTNAIVATPVCSPSRATYLSGRYPTELNITDWISPVEAQAGTGLAAPTWPQALQQHGYRTALIGKWHLGELPRFHPTRLGFHHFMGFLSGGNRPMNPILEVNSKTTKLTGSLPDLLVDDTLQFINQNLNQPFAIALHFRAPHGPYAPVPPQDSQPYQNLDPTLPVFPGLVIPDLKQKYREYYASITSVDRNIGRLLDALDKLNLTQNTLVLFTSDHGYNLGRHGISTKGNGAWLPGGAPGAPNVPNMWESSITVPLAIRWPAVIKPGTTIDYPVSQIDTYRTLLGALGIPIPDGASPRGIDFSPLLRGQSLPPRPYLFGQYDIHNSALDYLRMIRSDRYKYVRHFHVTNKDELYDLHADPDETRNLLKLRGPNAQRYAPDPKIIQQLRQQLVSWMESIDDPLLNDRY